MTAAKKNIIILTGPTAVGKTNAAIELALALETEIVSADSRQIYKEMSIGTAKPKKDELDAVPHHFINHISIESPYSAGDYMREARGKIIELLEKKDHVIVTGGTGLYLKALTNGINEFPEVQPSVVAELESIFEIEGIEPLQSELQQNDPVHYEKIDINNSRRVIRALSIIRSTGATYSSFVDKKPDAIPYPYRYFVIYRKREELYERINTRVDAMMKEGLLAEAKDLFPFKNLRSLKTVGYQELFDHFEGKLLLAEAIEKIKQHSRNYAKRQLTWFRGVDNAEFIDANSDVVEEIKKRIL